MFQTNTFDRAADRFVRKLEKTEPDLVDVAGVLGCIFHYLGMEWEDAGQFALRLTADIVQHVETCPGATAHS